MTNPYHTHGVFWQPRSKSQLIQCIVESGYWNGTKTQLKAMEQKQLRGIYNSIRFKQMTNIMKQTHIPQTHTQNEVKHE